MNEPYVIQMNHIFSYDSTVNAVIIGATGGIGNAFVESLLARENIASIHALSRSGRSFDDDRVISSQIDVTDEASIEAAAKLVNQTVTPNLIICATGILHDETMKPEKSYKHIEAANFAQQFAVNVTGVALVAKHFLPLLPRKERAVFSALSARVGSISDNAIGGWTSYRSAKAALNMTLKCLSIEMARTHPEAIIVGLHPGTVDTALSAPFQSGVNHALFTPKHSAEAMLDTIQAINPSDSGCLFAYDGEKIDF